MAAPSVVHYLLMTLCANYPPPNNNGTDELEFECDLNVTKGNKDFFKGKSLKLITFNDGPLSSYRQGPGGELKGGGIVFEVVRALQDKYNFKYEIVKGSKLMGDKQTGLLGQLAKGEGDMVAAFLPVRPGTHDYITWGTEIWQMKYFVMMRRPEDSASGSGLLAPFNKEVWFLILASLISVGPTIYLLMWLRRKLCPEEDVQVFPLSSCVWFVYGGLMKQGSTLSPISDSARLLFATWWIFILILTAFYTANLTAFLTLSLFTLPINKIEDIAKPPHKWFTVKGGPVESAIQSDGDLNFLSTVNNGRYIDITSEAQILTMLTEGWLFLNDQLTLNHLMFDDYKKKTEDGIEESSRCTYVLAPNSFLVRSLAFAYPKGSTLPDKFNSVVQTFVESGILHHLMNEGLPGTPICPLNLGNKERKLRNSDLWTTYVVVICGFSFSLVVFCIEILWRQYNFKKLHKKIHLNGIKHTSYLNKFPFENDFGKALKIKSHTQSNVNGRDYFMVNSKEGEKMLIPTRTPSALLFQYGFNYPSIL